MARVRRRPPMTRVAFLAWFTWHGGTLMVRDPYELLPCACLDVNCRGWRFVEAVS